MEILDNDPIKQPFGTNPAVEPVDLAVANDNISRLRNANPDGRSHAAGRIGAEDGEAIQIYGDIVNVGPDVDAVVAVRSREEIGGEIIGTGDGEVCLEIRNGESGFHLREGFESGRWRARRRQAALSQGFVPKSER